MTDPFSRALAIAKAAIARSPSTPSTRQQPWDADVAATLMHAMFERLCAAYEGPAGMFDDPGLIRAERAIDAAFLAADMATLHGALADYERIALSLMEPKAYAVGEGQP